MGGGTSGGTGAGRIPEFLLLGGGTAGGLGMFEVLMLLDGGGGGLGGADIGGLGPCCPETTLPRF